MILTSWKMKRFHEISRRAKVIAIAGEFVAKQAKGVPIQDDILGKLCQQGYLTM